MEIYFTFFDFNNCLRTFVSICLHMYLCINLPLYTSVSLCLDMYLDPEHPVQTDKQTPPLLAVGTVSGSVQIFNMVSGRLEKSFALYGPAVRGVDWITPKKVSTLTCHP